MKNYFYILAFLLICSLNTYSQSTYKSLIHSADSLYKLSNYSRSLDYYKKAFKLNKNNRMDLYNGACSAARANDIKYSFNLLNKAIEAGFSNLSQLSSDQDLANLKSHPYWSDFLFKIQKVVDAREAQYEQPLRKELLQILEVDQKTRADYRNAVKETGSGSATADSLLLLMEMSDNSNLKKVIEILEHKGWPSRKAVGDDGLQALFLVIQHSNLEIQEHYLPLMKEAVRRGDLRAPAFAMVQDRIAIQKGGKQIYGSQIGQSVNSKTYYVLPIEDPENIDKRRLDIGMEPMKDYVSKWGINWSIEEYQKGLKLTEERTIIKRPLMKKF